MSTAKLVCLILLSLTALVFTPRAFATSCALPELKTSTERAQVVFVGVVAAETPMGGGMGIYRLRVDRVFKGSVPATVTVSGGGMKGSSFTVGDRYLVFGRVPEASAARPPDLFAHLCGGTQPAARATDWLSALGAGNAATSAGTPIVAGAPAELPPAAPSSAPPAPSSDAPTAEPQPSAESSVQAPLLYTSSSTATTTPATSGGCAGCTSAHREPNAPVTSLTLLVLLVLVRRLSPRGGSSAARPHGLDSRCVARPR